jgi:CheY-like chemotaxis protein
MAVLNPVSTGLAGLRVVLIEDEPILALCLSELIEEHGGIVVGTQGSVAGALELVGAVDFDLAVLDLNLHGERVDAVAQAVTAGGHAMILSTGSGPSDIPAAFKGWPVLTKPYSDDDLLGALALAQSHHASRAPRFPAAAASAAV